MDGKVDAACKVWDGADLKFRKGNVRLVFSMIKSEYQVLPSC
jgi:hypothetical protein